MKKNIIITIVIVLIFIITSSLIYIKFNNKGNNNLESQTPNKIDKNSKSLVVYFSVPETDNPNNMTKDEENSTVVIDGKVLGNTEYVASIISKQTSSDLFRIEAKNAYPTNHQELLKRVKYEMENNIKPELKEKIDISAYDVIYLGYPIWNATLPPIINTFLDSFDFKNKTVIPFCTHGGSGLSGTPEIIKSKLSDAHVITNGFSIYRSSMDESLVEVNNWLQSLKLND